MRALILGLGLLAFILPGGCGKTVVDLTPEPDAADDSMDKEDSMEMVAPPRGEITCGEEFLDEMLLCKVCYQDGVPISRDCPAPPIPKPSSGAMCATRPVADGRCLYCAKPDAEAVEVACLKCLEPVDPGNPCRLCYWNDQDFTTLTCKMCKLADGSVKDDCDALRTELPPSMSP